MALDLHERAVHNNLRNVRGSSNSVKDYDCVQLRDRYV